MIYGIITQTKFWKELKYAENIERKLFFKWTILYNQKKENKGENQSFQHYNSKTWHQNTEKAGFLGSNLFSTLT